ncbi:MAG TPA: zinc-binding dehydrogenase [Syntrophorhabdaceae bacterium]|nr:zinc-binding dehydrogenase [Syntrophorhabdaceae bacterium]
MKVSYWYNNRDIRVIEAPTPQPGPEEMLVKVLSCGICGSDIVEWYRLPRAPLVQGHEIGAEVVQIGGSVKKYRVGDRVFIPPKIPCEKCYYCLNGHHPQCTQIKERLPGGFAEYILVPGVFVQSGTYLLPDVISYDQSTFIEPLACAVRAQRLAGVVADASILIIGCGMSGLLHLKLAKSKNHKVIVSDINKDRLSLAKRLGADATFESGENIDDYLIAVTGKKADVVIVCTGAEQGLTQAWQSVDKGGKIVLFAVPGPDRNVCMPVNDFWTKEITVLTSYYCGPDDIREAMRLIESDKVTVNDLITHKLPLSDIVRGFQLVSEGTESIKVIINPHAA